MCIFLEKGVALFHDSELEKVLGIIPPHSVDDLLRSYIHDFAFLAHRSVNAAGHKVSDPNSSYNIYAILTINMYSFKAVGMFSIRNHQRFFRKS